MRKISNAGEVRLTIVQNCTVSISRLVHYSCVLRKFVYQVRDFWFDSIVKNDRKVTSIII